MAVGLKIDFLWYQIGDGDVLFALFSTICYHLENKKWGSIYPVLMNELYQGKMKWEKAEECIDELSEIKEKLLELPVSKLIWDIENLDKNPPWGNNISSDIKNLYDYFITNDGRNLIDVIYLALNDSIELKENIEIECI